MLHSERSIGARDSSQVEKRLSPRNGLGGGHGDARALASSAQSVEEYALIEWGGTTKQ